MTHSIDTHTRINEPAPGKLLRLWPGAVAAVLLVLLRFVVPIVALETMPVAMMGAVVGALVILLWWLFFSRAPWSERLGVIALMIVALFATSRLVHESIAGGGMGWLLYIWAIPVMSVALVAAAAASRRLSSRSRRASIVAAILLACGVWTLLRTEGVTGDIVGSDFRWRWTPTPEQRLLAQAEANPPAPSPAAAAEIPKESVPTKADDSSAAPTAAKAPATTPEPAATAVEAPAVSEPGFRRAEWPGFRGPDRDAVVRGVRLETDWSKSPPVELWRRPIGPGWSSFAVQGDLLYTQEQRGDDEIVAAYRVTTGEPVWRHRDAARFYESNAGAGPRGTPTLSNGRVYTLGATGIVNALDASSGAAVWSRNAVPDTGVTIPVWGIASSPLVVDGMVVVAASGRLAAYDAATGKPRWFRQTGGGGYSSPHLTTIGGVTQILLLSGGGAVGVAPADGAVLWQHALWESATGIVQPATMEGDILIAAADAMGGIGMRRLAVAHGPGGWTAEERWTSRGLKPYFNDFVVHKGHAYGFDGSILSCIDVKDGARKWKGGRYGSGQLILLADQDLLLVMSEEGELALVKATPDQFTEMASKLPVIEGKTWNHPVLIGEILLVRNGQEMAAFRLSLGSR